MTARTSDPAAALARAAALGFAGGLRTFTPLAALSLRGGRIPGRPGLLLTAAAAGELVADKLPWTPSRLSAPALGGRLASGAAAGHVVAGWAGVPAGATAALAGAFAGHRARQALARATGWPDVRCALIEDAVATAVAGAAAR